MEMTPSQRTIKELPLLVAALALVGVLGIPLLKWTSNMPAEDRAAAVLHRFLAPEQLACYCCFTWAGLIVMRRYLELRRQRGSFALGMLPTEEGVRILPEDGRPLLRKVEQVTAQHGPLILASMIRMALAKFSVNRSNQDVRETVRTQAEVDQGRLVANMSTLHYLAWALPALGFLGTVRGLAGSLGMAQRMNETDFISQVSGHLTVAFDCTLVALALSLVVMFLLHSIQRDEEALVIDCRQYCLENLVNRLYELEGYSEAA